MEDFANATDRDQPRPVATAGDNDFTLSIEQVSERYAAAGHPRTIRTLQRYCASRHLDAQKIATSLGDKYLVTPLSVARHIAQIQELSALDNVTTGRDEPRPAAKLVAHQTSHPAQDTIQAPTSDEPRPTATGEIAVSRYVEQLEKRIEEKDDVIGLLKGQLVAKDEQIGENSQHVIGRRIRCLARCSGCSLRCSVSQTLTKLRPRTAMSREVRVTLEPIPMLIRGIDRPGESILTRWTTSVRSSRTLSAT